MASVGKGILTGKYMNVKPELISFNLCPFVQRSVITLLEKNIDFKLTYIDLYNPPEWFTDISPLGKVPVLKVGETVLFESAVINEYLDEINPPALHPADPLVRAKNRAWIEFGSDMIMNQYKMSVTPDAEIFKDLQKQLVGQFEHLEKIVGQGPYFNGSNLSLVDTAFAPLFMRFDLLNEQYPLHLYPEDSRIKYWSQALAKLNSVKKSVIPDFADVYFNYLKSQKAYFSTLISL